MRYRGRCKVLVAALGSVALAAGLVIGLPVPAGERGPIPVDAAVTPCLRVGYLDSVSDLNRLAQSASPDPAFLGADVGLDLLLPDDRRLWLFGDTLQIRGGAYTLVHNSMVVYDPPCLRRVLPKNGGSLISERDDGVGYWPLSVWDEEFSTHDVVRVMLQRVRVDGAGLFDFTILGPSVATFWVAHGGTPELVNRVDLGPDDPDPRRPMWGAAVVRARQWLYLYGTSTRSVPGIHGFAVRVARMHPADVAHLDRWRYWDGVAWQRDSWRTHPLLGERGGVSQSFSVFRRGRVWYAISKRDELLGRDLVVWRAASPHGPFDGGTVVAVLPCAADDGLLRYGPLAHPTVDPRPGTLVVSFSQNALDFRQVCADPSLYRPRFIRVRLPADHGRRSVRKHSQRVRHNQR